MLKNTTAKGTNEMTNLTDLINQTIDRVLDDWNSEADEQGIDRIDYYETQVEKLEDEPGRFTAKAISQRYMQRVMGVAK